MSTKLSRKNILISNLLNHFLAWVAAAVFIGVFVNFFFAFVCSWAGVPIALIFGNLRAERETKALLERAERDYAHALVALGVDGNNAFELAKKLDF